MKIMIANIVPKIKLPQPLLVEITYVKCALHTRPKIIPTLNALGLTRLHQKVIHKNIRPIRGMINKVLKKSQLNQTNN